MTSLTKKEEKIGEERAVYIKKSKTKEEKN